MSVDDGEFKQATTILPLRSTKQGLDTIGNNTHLSGLQHLAQLPASSTSTGF